MWRCQALGPGGGAFRYGLGSRGVLKRSGSPLREVIFGRKSRGRGPPFSEAAS